jgi:hypothetical protein
MKIGLRSMKLAAGLAHFGAIHQQADVSGIAHLAALRAQWVAVSMQMRWRRGSSECIAACHGLCFVVDHWTSMASW